MAGKAHLCPSLHADNATAKNRKCACLHIKQGFLCMWVRVVIVLDVGNPTFDQELAFSHEDHYKRGVRFCYSVIKECSRG